MNREEIIELAAAAAHDGWMEGKRAQQGVTSRSAEDGTEQMVPYADLPEAIKEVSREAVRAVLGALDDEGLLRTEPEEPVAGRQLLIGFQGRPNARRMQRVTIPAEAKVTFSGVNPAGAHGEKALRIYTSRDQQLACFTGVEFFRDTSIKVEQLVRNERTESKGERGHNHASYAEASSFDEEWIAE